MKIRNIAIIAHVDHGKTTLVDQLLQQSGTLGERHVPSSRMMDSHDLEKERGITILAKNTAIEWQGMRINVVDTPGHADFGGEVERILSMVDAVLLVVDAVDGPMPQTRFVTQKAFDYGLQPIVVVNKVDRVGARPDWAVDQVFDLFVSLGATDKQLDFSVVYASALEGYATRTMDAQSDNMHTLLDLLVEEVPAPPVDRNGPFQMQISALDYSSYVGAIGIGRIARGGVKPNQQVRVVSADGKVRSGKILQVLGFMGLERTPVDMAQAGDIVAISGIENMRISDTLCDPECVEALPALTVDEPTVSMTFQVNDSPFAGKEGKYLTARHVKERLERELIANVALRVEPGSSPDKFWVSGRGELHLSILIEEMRREGFELALSRPEVVIKTVDGVDCEPFEQLVVDVPSEYQGAVMQYLAEAKAHLEDMSTDTADRVRMQFVVPTRGLIGFHGFFQTATSGAGLMYHRFDHYAPCVEGALASRRQGVLISNAQGTSTAYALWNLESRGKLIIGPQTDVYEGMVVGIHTRANDLVVNVIKGKQLTNVRASGTDDNIALTPAVKMTLESALEFIADDELVEVTPASIRIRKRFLKEHERKRASRS